MAAESESENSEEDPWADPAKIGFNRGLEPLKIHESVQDSDEQGKWALLRSTRNYCTATTVPISVFYSVYFVVEWKNSKIIDFVKREECKKKCPKVKKNFLEN